MAARLVEAFARNVGRRLAQGADQAYEPAAPIAVGALLGGVIAGRIHKMLARMLGRFR